MERDNCVISGVNGFVGHHLAHALHEAGVSVTGIGQEDRVHPDIADFVDEYHQADLTKQWPNTSPARAVIHLAGLAAVGASFDKEKLYYDINTSMVHQLGEHYLKQPKNPRIVIVSSGALYGSDQPMPISEDGVINPYSPYAKSKVANEKQAAFYRAHGLDCVVVRPFNHIGPGQGLGFLLPDLYNDLSALRRGQDTITTGDLETRRDFTDVRDVARAYCAIALAKTLQHNTYNICSGASISGVEIFGSLKNAMGLKGIEYKIDPSKIRPNDARDIVGDSSRLQDELGWKPEIDIISKTIPDFVLSKRA